MQYLCPSKGKVWSSNTNTTISLLVILLDQPPKESKRLGKMNMAGKSKTNTVNYSYFNTT